ncbi:MAG: cystathionine beta-lyase [Alphaproteobacteria bacterium]|nr:cystathionine beta-lyase [Alphaproteobacteria bacterium]
MKDDTKLTTLGRDPGAYHGIVNPPVFHASTVLHPSVAAYEAHARARESGDKQIVYGRRGTPTSFAFEDAVAGLEGGHAALSYPSGLTAIAAVMLSFLKAGDHVLVCDSAYGPTHKLCDGILARLGVQSSYFDPLIGAELAKQMRPNTKLVYLESPGSETFEVMDVAAAARAAHAGGALVAIDNTWASPLYFKPLQHGCDLSIHAATKYLVGHSDAMMGVVTANQAAWKPLQSTTYELGLSAGPDDLYLAQRGMRTLSVRLERHQKNAMTVARWFQSRPEVARVLYPALPDDPGHALWKRDFAGASGLFSVEFKPAPKAAIDAMIDGLEYFGLGASWGGYESLVMPCGQIKLRQVRPWKGGPLVRFHIGLEDPADLMADLGAGLDRLKRAAATAA